MDADTKKEIRGRTLRLEAYDNEVERLEALRLRLLKLYSQTHVTINGKRKKLTKRKKIAMANKLIDRAFSENVSVENDTKNQVRLMDA